MIKKITICFVLALLSGGATAQQEWSLEKCIDHALSHNLQIKQEELKVDQKDNELLQSKLSLIPSLSGSSSYEVSWGRSSDQATIQFVDTRNARAAAGLSLSTPLFAGLQKQNTIKKNAIDLQAAQQDVEKLRNDLSLNIARAYLQILLDMESLEVAKEQMSTTVIQLEKTKKLVDAGTIVVGSYLDLQAQQASEELQIVTVQNKISSSYLDLKQMLDLQHDTTFRISMPAIGDLLNLRTGSNVDRIFEENASLKPEVKSAELKLKSAHKSLQIAQGAYYPTLMLEGGSSTFYSDASKLPDGQGGFYSPSFTDQFRENVSSYIRLALSIPIFNGWQTRKNVRNAKLNIRYSELQLETAKNTLYKDIQQADADAEAALRRYQASQKNVKALEESFRYIEQKFDLGMVDATNYNVAKNNLTKAQAELVQSKYQYIFQTKILDFYKGISIRL